MGGGEGVEGVYNYEGFWVAVEVSGFSLALGEEAKGGSWVW